MTQTIVLLPLVGTFASNKDEANRLRQEIILPTLKHGDKVLFDFAGIEAGTQSFIHALIAESFQLYGQSVLKQLEFKSCSPIIKNLIGLVIDYTRITSAATSQSPKTL